MSTMYSLFSCLLLIVSLFSFFVFFLLCIAVHNTDASGGDGDVVVVISSYLD